MVWRGIDVNGNSFKQLEHDPAKERGYSTRVDALHATLGRYWSDFFIHLSAKPGTTLTVLEQSSDGGQMRDVRIEDLPSLRHAA